MAETEKKVAANKTAAAKQPATKAAAKKKIGGAKINIISRLFLRLKSGNRKPKGRSKNSATLDLMRNESGK